MNELRWILLVAGVVLIAALYFWGMRSRGAGQGGGDAPRRPAVFSGGARGFEPAEPALDDDQPEPVAARPDPRLAARIEPSLAGDDATEDSTPDFRRVDFDDDAELERPAIGRREPTFSSTPVESDAPWDEPAHRDEGAAAPRAAAERVEPSLQDEAAAQQASTGAESGRRQKIFAIRVAAPAPGRFAGQQLLEALRAEGLDFGRYDIFHRLHDDGRPIFSVASLREPGTFDLEAMPATQYPGVAMFAVVPGPVPAHEAFDELIFTARALATHLNGALGDERGAPLTALRVGRLREEALEFDRDAGPA